MVRTKVSGTQVSKTPAPTTVAPRGKAKMGVNSFNEEMAKLAGQQSSAESKAAGGSYISTKGGHYAINGNPVKGDVIRAVIVDSAYVNTYYSKPYDPSQTVSPDCYAMASLDEELAPHAECDAPQHETCQGCPMNAFGTASFGKGKACKNQRRLALILEDDIGDPSAQMWMLALPPTSVKAWGSYVQQITSSIKRPTCGVLTELTIYTPAGQTYAQQSFAMERELAQDELAVVLPRRDEAAVSLFAPFPKNTEEEAPKPSRGKAKPTPKPATRKFSRS